VDGFLDMLLAESVPIRKAAGPDWGNYLSPKLRHGWQLRDLCLVSAVHDEVVQVWTVEEQFSGTESGVAGEDPAHKERARIARCLFFFLVCCSQV
jgi:hypothetical protein